MVRRRYVAKRRVYKKRKLTTARKLARYGKRRALFGRAGGFVLKRHIDLTTMYNNHNVPVGEVAVQQGDASGSTWLFLGTPQLATGGIAGNASTAVYDIPFAMNFKLADITSYTDITSIADKYKIGLVSIKVLNNGQAPSYLGGGPAPFIEYVYDHDDSNVPTIAHLTQKMGLRTKNFGLNGKCNIHVRPVPTLSVGESGSSAVALVPRRSPWLNATDISVNHYGIKGVIRNFYASSQTGVLTSLSMDAVMTVIAKDLQ